MALAQHHGFATPLLDWSKNPLVAAFFAVTDEPRSDGMVYCLSSALEAGYSSNGMLRGSLSEYLTVTSLGRSRKPVIKVAVPPNGNRMYAQQAAFTFSAPVNQSLESLAWPSEYELQDGHRPATENLVALRIPAARKRSIEEELEMCGFSHSRLFPDLDGVSQEVVRLARNERSSG